MEAILIISAMLALVAAFVVLYVLYFNRRKSALISEQQSLRAEFKEALLLAQVEVQEQTYQNIGKELHDNIGQLLSTARMLLGLTERTLTDPPEPLLMANDTLAQAIAELRSFSKSLDKQWLEQFHLVANLQAEINRINAGKQLEARLEVHHPHDLPADKQIILFRIVQEAMQNAVKHASAKLLQIRMRRKNDRYAIEIIDDGSGLPHSAKRLGMGLSNMKHRTALLGGTIEWQTEPSGGTCVLILIPLNEPA
ncbi:MAG: sensor histidine kinase [Chitinophagaceae bacterium]|nr:MAG: sensor histidine kinase [Chitinophagaceae bacterium]